MNITLASKDFTLKFIWYQNLFIWQSMFYFKIKNVKRALTGVAE